MISAKVCVVVVPVYKSLEPNDRVALNRLLEMTPGIDKVFILPESLVLDDSFAGFKHIATERFEDRFFCDRMGYNKLMLNRDFYDRFIDYRYMLIHQTDAFLFKPDLLYWCEKNYDLIGAPWLRPKKIQKKWLYYLVLHLCPWIYSPFKRRLVKHYNNVGNGGLSLRKIETFISILNTPDLDKLLKVYWEEQAVGNSLYNEDVFWSLEGPRLHKGFRKPKWQEAIRFSTEMHPSFAFDRMGKQLPFGCHAPLVHEPSFWKDRIPYTDWK